MPLAYCGSRTVGSRQREQPLDRAIVAEHFAGPLFAQLGAVAAVARRPGRSPLLDSRRERPQCRHLGQRSCPSDDFGDARRHSGHRPHHFAAAGRVHLFAFQRDPSPALANRGGNFGVASGGGSGSLRRRLRGAGRRACGNDICGLVHRLARNAAGEHQSRRDHAWPLVDRRALADGSCRAPHPVRRPSGHARPTGRGALLRGLDGVAHRAPGRCRTQRQLRW